MRIHPTLSPAGHLQVEVTASVDRPSAALARVGKAFTASNVQGLFALGAESFEEALPPALAWLRALSVLYLTELCHTPEAGAGSPAPIDVPSASDLEPLVVGAPPMPGAEYLSTSVLEQVWKDLDAWVRSEVAAGTGGLAGFLAERAPLWHQVGRVCFHLAENRRDAEFPFAFLATYAPTLLGAGKVRYRPLGKALQEYAGQKNRKALLKLLTPVHQASQQSPVVRRLLDSGDIYHPLAWTAGQAYEFLRDIPTFEDSGVLVRVPDWWRKRPRPRVAVSIGSRQAGALAAESMLDFKVSVALGNETLTKKEWQALKDADQGLALLRGQWVEVDRARLEEALAHWGDVAAESEDGLSFSEGMRLLAGATADLSEGDPGDDDRRQWSSVHAGPWLAEVLATLREPAGAAAASPSLKATLRPYQEVGVGWLRLLTGLGLGGCLADDMGLGKTVQVLALLLAQKDERKKTRSKRARPALLVLPASLLANWKAEMARFAPSLRAVFLHPSEMTKDEMGELARNPDARLRRTDAVLTTYGMLRRQPWLAEVTWSLVVLDEAQAIKNPGAGQTRAVKALESGARIALTGTPIENRLADLWSLFDFLCPGLLGSQKRFQSFVKALEKKEGASYAPLRSLVQPYILRRMKTDRRIIQDLPEKTEVKAFCGLSKRQAVLYGGLVDELAEALNGVDGMRRRGLVLASLLRFKQVCNHPSQLLDDGRFEAKESGKFQRLADLCDEISSRGEKVLVFTQFRSLCGPLAKHLTSAFGRPGLVLHGGTPVGRRRALVEAFQDDGGPPFFVLSLKAGGTGLNLTAASHVVHFDRWWNPAVENQATDRAFRIGQRKNVVVHKFVCQGTVEERIDQLIEDKTRLATEILEGGAERTLTEMADDELIRLVSLDLDRARI